MQPLQSIKLMSLFGRFALAAAFLSAAADRFGAWGVKGALGVSWGNMHNFEKMVGALCPWAPAAFVPTLAWGVTALEAALGILLILGLWLRQTSAVTFALLMIFSASMAAFLSVKLMLNFSVLTCAACAGMIYLVAPMLEESAAPAAVAARGDLPDHA